MASTTQPPAPKEEVKAVAQAPKPVPEIPTPTPAPEVAPEVAQTTTEAPKADAADILAMIRSRKTD